MYDTTNQSPPTGLLYWPRRVESWLDARGKGAWIAAMVLGFIFVWPLGLAILGYMIWSKRMTKRSMCCHRPKGQGYWASNSSGNSAFDAYRDETIRRLKEERGAFEAFLKRLRDAKDKQEFDAFMEDRAKANADQTNDKDIAAY
ncbi:DUF2852 domain-containing protein (plasmid) [Pseudorhodobacter turbinis]|uniref:DUF2852 domain-containing protein n=1 Tax=Pseudorhodobacter turbinis TaxID=2500533 RepID=A0A4P8EIK3_9RHOB|nr:DUF2852 domain-containing protein [Pseudorhodobacter turbinis]QCO56759.1 DUF2852 domain-containing protein [Pseudorhodobacter turbinis]